MKAAREVADGGSGGDDQEATAKGTKQRDAGKKEPKGKKKKKRKVGRDTVVCVCDASWDGEGDR